VKDLNTDEFPVEMVSWEDAQACIRKIKLISGVKKVSLPSKV
jgi:formylglycine-generating enzyme required for sulfatase activity